MVDLQIWNVYFIKKKKNEFLVYNFTFKLKGQGCKNISYLTEKILIPQDYSGY